MWFGGLWGEDDAEHAGAPAAGVQHHHHRACVSSRLNLVWLKGSRARSKTQSGPMRRSIADRLCLIESFSHINKAPTLSKALVYGAERHACGRDPPCLSPLSGAFRRAARRLLVALAVSFAPVFVARPPHSSTTEMPAAPGRGGVAWP